MPNCDPTNTSTYAELDGRSHRVHVEYRERRFHIVDIATAGPVVVETLMYPDDLAAAEALAVDYAVQKQAYHAGLRDDDPHPAASGSSTPRAQPASGDRPRQAAASVCGEVDDRETVGAAARAYHRLEHDAAGRAAA